MGTFKGVQDAIKELAALKERSRRAMRKGELKVAKLIAAEAKAKAPVNVGNVKSGIHVEQTEESTTVVGGDKIAAYQEFGTGPLVSIPTGYDEDAKQFFVNGKGKTSPQPFFFPAVFKYQEQIIPAVEEELAKIQ